MMIWTSNATKLLAKLRSSDPVLLLDQLSITAGELTIEGRGSLHRKDDQFILTARFDLGSIPVDFPNRQFGDMKKPKMYGREDFWQAQARTAEGVLLTCAVPPSMKWSERSDGITEIHCTTDSLNLTPQFLDACDFSFIRELLSAMNENPSAREYEVSIEPPQPIPSQYHAILPGVKPVLANVDTKIERQNPFIGPTSSNDKDTYIEERNDCTLATLGYEGDLHVYLKYKQKAKTVDEEVKEFEALLDAIAFTHGCHPHTRLREHCQDGRVVLCEISPNENLEQSMFAPISERLLHQYPESRSMLGVAWDYFKGSGALVTRFKQVLWLHRHAASKDVPLPVQVLTACTLFEGLIKALFDAHGLKNPTNKSENAAEYNAAKKDAQKWLLEVHAANRFAQGEESPWSRMSGALNDFPFVRPKERLQAVATLFGMTWEGDVLSIFDHWNSHRNPLAHGGELKQDFESTRKLFLAWSRLSGALHRFILHEMGYRGWFVYSPMEEDLYALQIPVPSQPAIPVRTAGLRTSNTAVTRSPRRFYPWLWRDSPLAWAMKRRSRCSSSMAKRCSRKHR
jgi:hypothetical protein